MGDDQLTRLVVNLTPPAVAALDAASAYTEDSRTDTVNRALQVYNAVVRVKPHQFLAFGDWYGPGQHARIRIKPLRWYHRLFAGSAS